MNPPPSDLANLSTLPYWMQLFAFIAGLLFMILTIIGLITQFVKRPVLKFRLTREIFFRITELGEAIFANGVMVAKNDGVFTDDVNFRLNKTDSPQKSFNLRVAYFGEKVRGISPFPEFNFFTTSPISYIPVFIPQRIVYFLAQESYEKNIKRAFEEFRIKVQQENGKFRNLASSIEPQQKEGKLQEFIYKIISIQNEYLGKIMELVQLEAGAYELEAKIFYKTKKVLLFNSRKSESSKIAFKIENNVKEIIRTQLSLTLQNITPNIVLAANNPVKYPEYSPVDVKEL